MDKKDEVKELEANSTQAEGYVEAIKSGFHEIGDQDGEDKADEVLEKINEVREYVRNKTEKDG